MRVYSTTSYLISSALSIHATEHFVSHSQPSITPLTHSVNSRWITPRIPTILPKDKTLSCHEVTKRQPTEQINLPTLNLQRRILKSVHNLSIEALSSSISPDSFAFAQALTADFIEAYEAKDGKAALVSEDTSAPLLLEECTPLPLESKLEVRVSLHAQTLLLRMRHTVERLMESRGTTPLKQTDVNQLLTTPSFLYFPLLSLSSIPIPSPSIATFPCFFFFFDLTLPNPHYTILATFLALPILHKSIRGTPSHRSSLVPNQNIAIHVHTPGFRKCTRKWLWLIQMGRLMRRLGS